PFTHEILSIWGVRGAGTPMELSIWGVEPPPVRRQTRPKSWVQKSWPEALRAAPTPNARRPQSRMLARWSGLPIHAAITASALSWPRAMFSAQPRPVSYPAAFIRSAGPEPSAPGWPNWPVVAMSTLWARAARARPSSSRSGSQPWVDRSLLVSVTTSFSSASESDTDTVPVGLGVAVSTPAGVVGSAGGRARGAVA